LVTLTPKAVSDSPTKAGWMVGGGLETVLWGKWRARAEYRYADFGTSSFTVARSGTEVTSAYAVVDNVEVRLRTHTATFGLAYKFGDPVVSDQAAAFAYDATSAASWSGLYAGLGLGARVSQSETTTTSAIFSTPFDLTGAALSRSFDGTASRGNPYLGFNWQFMPRWVAGIEGDVGIVNQSTTQSGFFTPFFQSFAPSDSVSLKTTWDASLRGRIGLLLSPATMAYITSGVAWQHYEVNTTCASFSCTLNGLAPALVSVSTTKVGLDDWRRS
jgi:outer membrane immunogenic protein